MSTMTKDRTREGNFTASAAAEETVEIENDLDEGVEAEVVTPPPSAVSASMASVGECGSTEIPAGGRGHVCVANGNRYTLKASVPGTTLEARRTFHNTSMVYVKKRGNALVLTQRKLAAA